MEARNMAIFALTAFSFASLVRIVLKYDPLAVGWPIKVLFFMSLALFLAGIGFITWRLQLHQKKKSN